MTCSTHTLQIHLLVLATAALHALLGRRKVVRIAVTTAERKLHALIAARIPVESRQLLVAVAGKRRQLTRVARVVAAALALAGRVEIVAVAAAAAVREHLADTLVSVVVVATLGHPAFARIDVQQTVGLGELRGIGRPAGLLGLRPLLRLSDWHGVRSLAALRAAGLGVEVVGVAAEAAVVELATAGIGRIVVPAGGVVLALANFGGQLAQILGCGW